MSTAKASLKRVKKHRLPLSTKTPEQLKEICTKYFQDRDENNQPYTISGLSLALETNSTNLLNYAVRDGYAPVIAWARERILDNVVTGMLKQKLNTVGCIFYLKNAFGWADKQETTTNVNITLVDQLKDALKNANPNRTLDAKVQKAGRGGITLNLPSQHTKS